MSQEFDPFDITEVPICLLCEERPATVRGQCRRCRQGTSRAIESGMISEQALIEHGVLLPPRTGPLYLAPVKWREKLEELKLIARRPTSIPSSTNLQRPTR